MSDEYKCKISLCTKEYVALVHHLPFLTFREENTMLSSTKALSMSTKGRLPPLSISSSVGVVSIGTTIGTKPRA